MVMFVAGSSAWADTATFDFTKESTGSISTGKVFTSNDPNVTLTFGTVSNGSSITNSNNRNCLSIKDAFSISVNNGTITSIVVTANATSSFYGAENIQLATGQSGTYSGGWESCTWTGESKVVNFEYKSSTYGCRTHLITVTYEDDTPYEPIVYTVNVTGSNNANAGVVYKGNTYHNTETISVRNALTDRDLTVADVDGMEGSFEIDGNNINVSYTKSTFFEYSFNVSASSLQVQQGVSVSYYFWSWHGCANPYSNNPMKFTSTDKKIVKIELNGEDMKKIVEDPNFTTYGTTQIVWEGSSKTVTFNSNDGNGALVRTAKIWLEQEAAPVTYHVTIAGNPSAASITVDGVTGSYGNGSSFDTTEDITVGKVHATEIDDYKCTVSVVGTDITVTYTEKPKAGDVITFDLSKASPQNDGEVTATFPHYNGDTAAFLAAYLDPLVITSGDANILSVELVGTNLEYINATPAGLSNGTWEGYAKSVSFKGNNYNISANVTRAIVTLESLGEKTYTVVFDPSDIGGSITIGGNTLTPANNSVILGKTLDLSKVETVVDPEGWYHEDGDVTFNSGTNTFYVTYHEYDHYAVSVNLADGRAIFNGNEYANESTINSKGVPTVTAKTVNGYNNNVAVDSENKTVTVTYTAWPTWTVSITTPDGYEGVAVVKVDGNSYDSDDQTEAPDHFVRGTLVKEDVTATRIPRYNANITVDQENHIVAVTYSALPVGELKFNLVESLAPAQGMIDEWGGNIRINAPTGVTFDYPEGGEQNAFSFQVNGASQPFIGVTCRPDYINIPLPNTPVELGIFTITIPANTFYGTYSDGGVVKSTTHDEVTLTYTIPYRYTYAQLNEQGNPIYDSNKTILVDGVEKAPSTISLDYQLTNENMAEHIDATCQGYDTEVTITPMKRYEDSRTHEVTWDAGYINVKYTKTYQYDDVLYTDATISSSNDNVTINFTNGVKRNFKCQENITFNGRNVKNQRLSEMNEQSYYQVLDVDFDTETESGTFNLVIPKGYYQVGGTNEDPILSNELVIAFDVVADTYTDVAPIEKSVNGIAGDELTFENHVVQIINVPTLKTPSDQTVNASLSIIEDGKLKVSFAPQTDEGTYTLTFGIRCLKFDDGTYNNPFSVTYNVTTPALAVKEGFGGWTSFCLDVPFKLASGTPYYVAGTEANGITLNLERIKPVRESEAATLDVKAGFPTESGKYLTIRVENDNFTPGESSLSGTGDVTFSTEGTDAYIVAIDMRENSAGSQTFDASEDSATKFEGRTQNVVMHLTAAELQNVYVTLDVPGDVIIPAGEGILIEGTPGAINYTKLPGATKLSVIENNKLTGKLAQETVEGDPEHYYFKFGRNKDNDPESIGFYWGSEDGHSITMNPNKAYIILPTTEGVKSRFLINGFDEETTAIDAVDNVTDEASIYNLQGKRMSRENLTSGVYIKNGKKFIVK